MRAEKSEKFNELKHKKGAEEYDEWFLRYRPSDSKEAKEVKKEEKKILVTKKNKTKKNKTKKNKGFMEKLGIKVI
jgi:hypothetical protein